MAFKADKTLTAADQACTSIREMVFVGDLRPGQRVSQRRLAQQLGCSTVPVLEAMRRLESDGLLVTAPHCMAKIRELSIAELEGLYLVREGLESVAARLAATRISADCLGRLSLLSDRFDRALASGNHRATNESDVQIHKLIAEAAQCPLLGEELDRLLLIERTAGQTEPYTNPVSTYTSHRVLVETLANHDADAAEYFIKKHIQAGCRNLFPSNKRNQS